MIRLGDRVTVKPVTFSVMGATGEREIYPRSRGLYPLERPILYARV